MKPNRISAARHKMGERTSSIANCCLAMALLPHVSGCLLVGHGSQTRKLVQRGSEMIKMRVMTSGMKVDNTTIIVRGGKVWSSGAFQVVGFRTAAFIALALQSRATCYEQR
eukprot:1231028-Amphidinium_carterae.5